MPRVEDKTPRKTPIDQSFFSYHSFLYNFTDHLIRKVSTPLHQQEESLLSVLHSAMPAPQLYHKQSQ